MKPTDVSFASRDTTCAGWWYRPPGEAPASGFPAVAMAHGIGAVKEMHLAPFAERLASAGIAVLLFDYRFFGASGGQPRQQVLPAEQVEDYKNALTWLSLQSEVDGDRLGVWGTSFSGAHALHLGAFDPRVKAVVAQAMPVDMTANVRAMMPPEALAGLYQMIVADRVRRYAGGEPQYIPLTGRPGDPALLTDPDTYHWLTSAQASIAPAWENRITIESVEMVLEYTTAHHTAKIAPAALLMILLTGDTVAPTEPARHAFDAAGEPKRLLELPGGHYDAYHGPSRDQAATAAVEWFHKYL